MSEREAVLREHVDRYLAATTPAAASGVVGTLLTGSLAAGFADEYADVDVTVVVDPSAIDDTDKLTAHLVPDEATVQRETGEKCSFDWAGEHVDVDIVSLATLRDGEWDLTTRWEYDNADVLEDPSGRLGNILDEQVPFAPGERAALVNDLTEGFLWTAGWDVYTTCLRDDQPTAHTLVTEARDALVKLLYLRDGAFVPRKKWRLRGLSELPSVDDETIDLIWDGTTVTAPTNEDVHRRVVTLRTVWDGVRPGLLDQGLVESDQTWHVDPAELRQLE